VPGRRWRAETSLIGASWPLTWRSERFHDGEDQSKSLPSGIEGTLGETIEAKTAKPYLKRLQDLAVITCGQWVSQQWDGQKLAPTRMLTLRGDCGARPRPGDW